MAQEHRAFDYQAGSNVRSVPFEDHHEIERLISLGWSHLGNTLWSTPNEVDQVAWQPKPFLPPLNGGCIQSEGLVLTHPVAADLADLCANEIDSYTRQHAIFPPTSAATLRALIAGAYPGWRLGDSTFLIARAYIDGPPVVKLSVRRLVPPGVLDVGYATMPAHRGYGYAARALRLFTDWAFDSAGIQRIELGIKPSNLASVRTAVKAGYALESVRRSRLMNADTSFDDEHSYVAVNADRNRGWGNVA